MPPQGGGAMPAGDVIKLSSPGTREFWEIPVLFEDDHLLAVDKPSGLLTSPDRYDRDRPNLMKLLHAGIAEGKPWAREHGRDYLANAHRLDFETSGIILLAKNKPALVALADQFGSNKPHKRYVALVNGGPVEDKFVVDVRIAPHPAKLGLMHIDKRHGKKSTTRFEVLEKFRNHTLLRCEPVTGRTHQIRVHLRFAKLPIVGDTLYHGAPLKLSRLKRRYTIKEGEVEKPLIARVALHAEELTLPHPVTGETVTIKSPWPKDFAVAVKYLRRYGSY
jgi:RluA family pseudouridine synthase